MPDIRRVLVVMLASVAALSLLVMAPAPAQAQDSWQYHMAQANSFYRNKLLPKALTELKAVVNDPQGAKQLKAWQLIQEISVKLKDLESLVWSLEKGRELAKGPEAAQMQAQLYRLKRAYGRVVYEATGGSGKLSARGVKVKNLSDIDDPEQKAYYEKTRLTMGQIGISNGSYWLPVGEYEIDGEQLKVIGGKDTIIEVAPTTFATLGVEIAFGGGVRAGQTTTRTTAGLGVLHLGFGPHIQFASGNSLVINVGPLLQVGAQQPPQKDSDFFERGGLPRLNVGGMVQAGLEFTVGKIDLSPRVGFHVSYQNAYYFADETIVVSGTDTAPATIVSGEFLVPAIAAGFRIGIDAIVSPAIVKGKRRPRLFVGVHGGPSWANPLWGDPANVDYGESISNGDGTLDGWNEGAYADTAASEPAAFSKEDNGKANAYVDIQAVLGIQLRL